MSNDVRENRLRRAAIRQGLRVVKARRMDPKAWDFGLFYVMHGQTDVRAVPGGMTIDELEDYLMTREEEA